jgi:uncharacterized protein (DUF2141 family)
MIRKILHVKILVLLLYPAITLKSQNVEVTVTGIRNTNGQLVIGIFKDNESFQAEKSFLEKRFVKTGILNGEMKVQFNLEAGIYGISLLDDENSNGKMEYNFLGIPKEGFGFSDYYHTGLTKPKFDAFRFKLDQAQTLKINIRIRYM